MRGTVVKGLREKSKQDVLIATLREKRQAKVGEIETVYRARKKAYLILTRGEPQPKLRQSRRQNRFKNPDRSVSADRYRDRPMKKSGATMRIEVKKPRVPAIVEKVFKKLFNSPKNKLIIEFLHISGFGRKHEQFPGIKTLEAAKKIIAKRQAGNLKKATWWDADRKPISLIAPEKTTNNEHSK